MKLKNFLLSIPLVFYLSGTAVSSDLVLGRINRGECEMKEYFEGNKKIFETPISNCEAIVFQETTHEKNSSYNKIYRYVKEDELGVFKLDNHLETITSKLNNNGKLDEMIIEHGNIKSFLKYYYTSLGEKYSLHLKKIDTSSGEIIVEKDVEFEGD